MARGYSVHIEARPEQPDAEGVEGAVTDEAIDVLTTRLSAYSGITFGDSRSWGATFTVSAGSCDEAAEYALSVIDNVARRAGLPAWPFVRLEVTREDVLDEDLSRSQLPDLLSTAEIAEQLGVSPQRVLSLAAGHADFPAPFIDRPHAKLWVKPAIDRFAESWDRKPGRPAKGSAA
jgi:hypothetical protein